MLKSPKPIIYPAHKCQNANNSWHSNTNAPVPKSTTSDASEPMSYRGINVTPAIYKLYCNILNELLQKWEQEQEMINDAQNGF